MRSLLAVSNGEGVRIVGARVMDSLEGNTSCTLHRLFRKDAFFDTMNDARGATPQDEAIVSS